MAISTKKKNIIIAMWKTGNFKSYTSIAKHYKISTKTAQKILGENSHDNEDIVDLGVQYEMAKISTKNPHEITSIEKVVNDRLKVSNMTNKVLDKLNGFIDGGKAKKVITVGQGMGISQSEIVEYDMQPEHYEKIINTIHKAGQTLGVVDSGSAKVEVNNQNLQVDNEITITRIGK